VLLLDEPFGAVDPKVRQRLRADTKGWQREMGIPTIMVTHDQREALEMGDRVAVMNQGRVEQIDTPQNVCDRPATEFAGRFIGRVNVPSAGTGQNWGRLMKDTRFEIMARPEDISISPWERKQPLGDGQIPGTIVDYAFLRRTVRLEVEVRTGRVLTIDLPKHDAVVNDLKPGTSVALAVGPCQEFPVYSRSLNGSRNTARGVGSAESE
jgi:ABC-type Fe3+/spermidine/putrescine transport system ATPase subunit